MLKIFFCALVLANLALFALQRGYLESFVPSGHEPQRLQQQLNPEKMRLLSSTAAIAPAPTPPAVAREVVAAPAASCAELGDFSEAEASRFEAKLGALTGNARLSRRIVADPTSYMVYIPSQGDKEGADRKAGELRRMQVTDFFVMQSAGDLRFGISLGIFKTRSAAEAHLAELTRKGVHSARVGGRGAGAGKFALQLHDLDGERLAGALRLVAGFNGIVQRECGTATG